MLAGRGIKPIPIDRTPLSCQRIITCHIKYPLGYVPISSSALRALGAAYIPILLSEVEQEQRPSGSGDRKAIVVGAGLATVRASVHTPHMPHIMIFPHFNILLHVSN